MFRNLALSLIFGIFTIVGQAQAVHPKGLDTVQWDVDGSWYFIPFAPDRPAFTFRNDLLKSISRPAGDGNGWCFRDGEAWFISISSEQGTEEKLNFWHSDLAKGTWEILGDIETKHGFPVLLYKLSGDDFLGINWLEGFQSEKSASFAARFRLKEKGLVFQSLVSVPFGELASVLKSASAPMALDPGGSSLPATFEWQHPWECQILCV